MVITVNVHPKADDITAVKTQNGSDSTSFWTLDIVEDNTMVHIFLTNPDVLDKMIAELTKVRNFGAGQVL